MDLAKTFFTFSFILLIFHENALGINIELKQKEIEGAIKYGEENAKDIFKSSDLKHACINFWPNQGGVLARSKHVDLMVTAAMRFDVEQKITDKEIKDITTSPYLRIQMHTKDDVVISLKQEEKIIESVNVDYVDPCCELCKFSGGNRDKHDFVTSSFSYSNLDPHAKTTIIIKGPYHEREYNVNLSKIK